MSGFHLDWNGVLSGPPASWLLAGLLNTGLITVLGSITASVLALALILLRTSELRALRNLAQGIVLVFRNTPLLVQIFFWYFAVYPALPEVVRDWIVSDHWFSPLANGFRCLSPEFFCAWLGLSWFTAAFLAEELRTGLQAVPLGQAEAARSQGLSRWKTLRYILLPQAMCNAWQPMIGQYLNLMKLSSLASGIGFAEIIYSTRQIESFNSHAIEAYAIATLLYLILGLLMGQLLLRFGLARYSGFSA
ncbi:amino acid ABC transporter permease [Undibacterium crateris]|uniref:amino acid ABC transporter permease n=1 Tax=Undibacterium crateris TaxID=2528175 RepID=UPI001389CDED|nr:amino acid ABC transporter permease [Undibacterium crateris]NDI85893.1 ABC transporter permease subunit [Undibacterium crateris]